MKKIIFLSMVFLLIGNTALAGSATVIWDANTEPDLVGYRVYYGTVSRGAVAHPSSGGYPVQNRADVFATTTKVLSNLSEGQTYYFSVTAFDTSGNESNYSVETSKYIPVNTCTSFNYGEWSTCTLGSQTRQIVSSLPANCTGGNPVLSQSCTVPGGTSSGGTTVTCTSFTYSAWSTCSSQGVRTRSVTAVNPTNCTGGTRVLQENCTPESAGSGDGGATVSTCTAWSYGAWSACANGKQTRQVSSATPANCSGGSPVIQQNCESPVVVTPVVVTVKSDEDDDGLSNDLEIALGTDPKKKDTDGDTFSDKMEILGDYNAKGAGKLALDPTFSNKQKGRIFIQVEGKGEAWYINPTDGKKYYLGRPKDAFDIMRKFSLGVVHKFITDNNGKAYAAKYRGRILLDVEDSGKAYYIDIKDGLAYYLGSPANAYEVIRKRGSGIKNSDISKISTGLIE